MGAAGTIWATAIEIAGGNPAVGAALFDEAPAALAILHVDALAAADGIDGVVASAGAGAHIDVAGYDRRGRRGGNASAQQRQSGEPGSKYFPVQSHVLNSLLRGRSSPVPLHNGLLPELNLNGPVI
jgi:hypothetical protein